jgi:hypothetical protein
MKNIFLSAALFLAAILATGSASAQFTFTKLNQPYTHLTGATSLSKNSLWTSDTVFTAPIGFNFKMAGATIDKFYLGAANFASPSKNSAIQSGFIMLGTGLMDRGQNFMQARSDIRYLTTGTPGARIFKLEVYNAGFEDEWLNYGELKDSVSYQLWLYEGSNVAEFRYGNSRVSEFNEYFGPKMMCGYMKNMDTATITFDRFWVASGNPATATLDSMSSFMNVKGLSSFPTSGTVFRFAPKGNSSTGIGQLAPGSLARVYPTQSSGTVNVEHRVNGTLTYAITSTLGQVVSKGSLAAGSTTIDLSSMPAGAYFIRIADEASNTYEGQKIIKY